MQLPYGNPSATSQDAGSLVRTDNVIGGGIAALLGVLIIGVVGFSHVEAFHNAAHDVRHSNGFPCH